MSTELTIIVGVLGFLITVLTTGMAVSKFFGNKMDKVKEDGRKEAKLDSLLENLIKEVRIMGGKLEGIEMSSSKQTIVCTQHRDETLRVKLSLDKAWEKIDALIEQNKYLTREIQELKGEIENG